MKNKNSFTISQKQAGELALRSMSDIANEYYAGTDGVQLAVVGSYPDEQYYVSFDYGNSYEAKSLKQIEEDLEELRREEIRQEAIDAQYEGIDPCDAQYWREIGEKYSLTEEFEENAIY